MGVDPKIWGPYTWAALHLMCEGAPMSISAEARGHYRAFFAHLAHVLPCGKCADHLQQVLARHPLGNEVLTREHLIEWCVGLHNEVAKDITKDIGGGAPMAMSAARKHWEAVALGKKPAFPSVCAQCGGEAPHAHVDGAGGSKGTSWALLFIILVVGIAIGGGVTYSIKKKR